MLPLVTLLGAVSRAAPTIPRTSPVLVDAAVELLCILNMKLFVKIPDQ